MIEFDLPNMLKAPCRQKAERQYQSLARIRLYLGCDRFFVCYVEHHQSTHQIYANALESNHQFAPAIEQLL
jgi:hypothetical protein